jgi:hypothetical protein
MQTRLNPHALFLRPKRNNLTSDSTQYVLLLCCSPPSARGISHGHVGSYLLCDHCVRYSSGTPLINPWHHQTHNDNIFFPLSTVFYFFAYLEPRQRSSSLQPWRWRQHASLKRWLLPTHPHGDLTQKNIIRIVIAVKILNLARTTWFTRIM